MQLLQIDPLLIRATCFLALFCFAYEMRGVFATSPVTKASDAAKGVYEPVKHVVGSPPCRVVVGIVAGWWSGHRWLGLLGGGLAYALPLALASYRQRRQQAKLELQLLDGLTMMHGGLRAGFNLYQVMELVAREAEPPLADIAGRIAREVQLGVPMDMAWQRAGQMVQNKAFGELVTAVVIQRQMGGDLGLILNTLQGTIREQINLREKLKSVTSQGRLTGMVISILPLALGGLIYFIMPRFIEPLLFNPIGQILLGIAFALEVVGMWMINRICRVET